MGDTISKFCPPWKVQIKQEEIEYQYEQNQKKKLSNIQNQFEFQQFVHNQAAPSGIDPRKQVKADKIRKYPYKLIGKTLAYFLDQQKNQYHLQGTAFFVGKNLLLTCAHNVCNKNNQSPIKIQFYPAQSNDLKRIKLEVKQFKIAEKYQQNDLVQFGSNIYDIALLELKEQNLFKTSNEYFKINCNFDYKSERKAIILAAGYPHQYNGHADSCYMYDESSTCIDQDKHYLYYKHTTTDGQSGMPLLKKINQNNYDLIGLHKGIMKGFDLIQQKKKTIQKACGIVFNNENKQMICEMAEELKVSYNLGFNYEPSKKKLWLQNQRLKELDANKSQMSLHEYEEDEEDEEQLPQQSVPSEIEQSNAKSQSQINQTDFKQFKKWQDYVYKHGDAMSKYNLAKCYFYGKGVQQNIQKAIQLFIQAAQQGDSDAQFFMGDCYLVGNGVEQNQQKAVQWYNKAAQQGDTNAKKILIQLGYL